MVTSVTSLTGNGLKDWLIQRITAVYFAIYTLVIMSYIVCHAPLQFESWQMLFEPLWFKIATVLALFALLLHAWIGVWTVTTDYIKCTCLRLSVQILIALALWCELFWCLTIVWGR